MNLGVMTIIAAIVSVLITIAAFALGTAPDVGGAVGFGTFIMHVAQSVFWAITGGMAWHWHLDNDCRLKDS